MNEIYLLLLLGTLAFVVLITELLGPGSAPVVCTRSRLFRDGPRRYWCCGECDGPHY